MAKTTWMFALAIAASLTTGAFAADANVAAKDKIRGTLEEFESDSFSIVVSAPSALDVIVELDKDLRVHLLVFGPEGNRLDTDEFIENALGKKPRIRELPITKIGAYRVVIESAVGQGGYELKIKLGNHAPRKIDMDENPPQTKLAAYDSLFSIFDPAGTSLVSKDVQNALAELSQRVDGSSSPLAALRTDPAGEFPSRFDRVSSAVSLLVAERDIEFAPTRRRIGATDMWIVNAEPVAETVVRRLALRKAITIDVTATYVAESSTPETTSDLRDLAPDRLAAWAWIGDRVALLKLLDDDADAIDAVDETSLDPFSAAAMGVPAALRTQRKSYRFRLVHVLTQDEIDNGFKLAVEMGMLAMDRTDLGQTGAKLRINNVTISGQ